MFLNSLITSRTFQLPWWVSGKESTCKAGDMSSILGSGRSSGEERGNLTPVSHGHKSLVGYSPWGRKRVGLNLATKQQVLSVTRFQTWVQCWIFLWWFYVRFVCLSFLVLYFPCLLLRHSPVLHTCVEVIVRTLRMAMLAFNVGFSRYRWFEVVELSFLIILNMCAACVFIFMSLFTCFFPSYMYQFWFWQLLSF